MPVRRRAARGFYEAARAGLSTINAVRRWASGSWPAFGVSALAGVLLIAAVLALLSASERGRMPSATAKCSTFGTTWRLGYNKQAAKAGNPIRILDACCRPASQLGVTTASSR